MTFGSPCIDAANSVGAPLTDIDGTARFNDLTTPDTGAGPLTYYDIGAYEFDGDSDDDGVPDDGDMSGDAGDNPCTGGATTGCDDNCRTLPNGPDLGTCTAGTVGSTCLSNSDCGPDGTCSLAQEDTELDGIGDVCDNCKYVANGPLLGICARLAFGLTITTSIICQDDGDCTDGRFCLLEQMDTNSNGAGDACECNANMTSGDCKVNLTDLGVLKSEFGRTNCSIADPCDADTNNDNKVNLTDLMVLKSEFGRTNCEPCPSP